MSGTVLFFFFLAKPGGEFFVDGLAMADCHQTNGSGFPRSMA
jgi:hypothetical protein